MGTFTPHMGLTLWTILSLVHIILSWIGARKLLKLEIDPFVKFIWILAIFFVPLAGVATFFVLLNSIKRA